MKRLPVAKTALLLFGSGFCALVYQVAWLRLLRLIFGSSTPATAAVVAIFMGGIGAGSLVLGPRCDQKLSPLGFYARLELGISVSAALSPFLVLLARWAYIVSGGAQQLGMLTGTVLRIALAALVLGLPTFLMGGTLPAVARAVEGVEDRGRRLLGLLYGANTLGAVVGAVATTFFSIEVLGIRRSIWIASLVNVLVALLARELAREFASGSRRPKEVSRLSGAPARPGAGPVRSRWVFLAAATVGFAFFLMELVWYRMLAPLLGGSSYTFGLILAVALFGIGTGGLLYGAGERHRRPTLNSFAVTCSLEALLLMLPFVLGDRLAATALVLRDLGGVGFPGLVVSWTAVTAIVVLPPALVAGYQFPLLVAILGTGRDRVGSEVGWTYAWNTAGAIAGSLAGGFGLLPLLSATGAWKFAALLLVALAAAAAWLGARSESPRRAVAPAILGLAVVALCTARGPSAFWRHSPIGAGRLTISMDDRNHLENAIHRKNRIITWQAEGRESSIAMQSIDGVSFLINGKVDGHARNDASTQVMSGLMGAALHPDPRRALIIGLGTGSTAGWLARVPSVEQVDVVELEPAIRVVARECEPVNQAVMSNPKVRLIIGDGREVLLTTPRRYDVVFSEPSNPYRAGIASLFTRDFYEAISQRLTEEGLFVQWLQAYEVDAQIVRTALATLAAVFESVETWHTNQADLLLVASNRPLRHDPIRLGQRLREEPYNSAMNRVWGTYGAEGFYAGFIASQSLAKAILREEARWINTDDRPIIEFGFARNVGRSGRFQIADLISLAERRGENRPRGLDDQSLDWQAVADFRAARSVAAMQLPLVPTAASDEVRSRNQARQQYVLGDLQAACAAWFTQGQRPHAPIDVLMVAECLAETGDPRAPDHIVRLRAVDRPIEAEAVLARWLVRTGSPASGTRRLVAALEGYRSNPWPHRPTMERLLEVAAELARSSPTDGREIFRALEEPFSLDMLSEIRRATLFDIAHSVDFSELCVPALDEYEPWVPWDERFLRERLRCYRDLAHPLAGEAQRDLESFLEVAPLPLDRGLAPEGGSAHAPRPERS